MVPFVIGGKVSKVIFDGFNDGGMKDDLLTIKNKFPYYSFYFIGPSIGGAMASLAAATFQNITGFYSRLYTFGQPRIGDKDFANAVDNMMLEPYRFIHKADIVPHLPPLNASAYYHHGQEYWYNNDMGVNDTYSYCTIYGEDQICSDSLDASDYNMKDHKYYFGRDIVEYGINGCPDLVTSKQHNSNLKNTGAKICKNNFMV